MAHNRKVGSPQTAVQQAVAKQ